MHLRNGQDLTLTTDGTRNGRDTIPVGWAGLPARGQARRRDLPRRRLDPAARARVRGDREVLTQGRDRRHGGLAPGHEPARRRGRPGRGRTSPTSTGSTSRSSTASTCSRCRSCASASDLDPVHARLEERGEDIPVIAKIEKREAAEAAEEIVQARRRDHGRARRPRHRGADRERAADPEAAAGARRALLQAVHHGHPDARLDGALHAPDARRGDRRRERRLRRHRRADALRGDRDRAATRSRRCA